MDPVPKNENIEAKTGNEQVDSYCDELTRSLAHVIQEHQGAVTQMIATVKNVYRNPELLPNTKLTDRAKKVLHDAFVTEGRLKESSPEPINPLKEINRLRNVLTWEDLFQYLSDLSTVLHSYTLIAGAARQIHDGYKSVDDKGFDEVFAINPLIREKIRTLKK